MAHSLASKGVKTKAQMRREYGEYLDNNRVQNIFKFAIDDIRGQLKESYENMENARHEASEYGIYDTASNEAFYSYIEDVILYNIKKLKGNARKKDLQEIKEKYTYRDGTYNPFSIYDIDGWKGVSRNVENTVKSEARKIAKKLYKYDKLGATSDESVRMVIVNLNHGGVIGWRAGMETNIDIQWHQEVL